MGTISRIVSVEIREICIGFLVFLIQDLNESSNS